MKCPHCGIEIRDTMNVCMYCGGKIPQRKGSSLPASGKVPDAVTRAASRPLSEKRSPGGDEEEEEEGGLSACLQPGEQVLIGSLNVSVKKFFFHAYLTNQRIFLIDTQEKKLKVTAKDIPLDTIAGTGIEFSENSDPVLVVSIRSPDDEIRTMKLVFAGNGMDRSAEVDEWVELLQEQGRPGKHKKPAAMKHAEPAPEVPEDDSGEGPGKERPPKPVRAKEQQHELRPAKRPVKDHEKQPPVKRLLSLYKTEPEEEGGGDEISHAAPDRAAHKVTPAGVPVRKVIPQQPSSQGKVQPAGESPDKGTKRVEVQSAMKGAMKDALAPVSKSAERPVRRPVAIPTGKKPVRVEPEPEPVLARADDELASPDEEVEQAGEEGAGPLFCQNCGKKLPAAANFCPGCGTKISAGRERHSPATPQKTSRAQNDDDEKPALPKEPALGKPAVKKVPKGSEMTILHKFLRR